MNIFDNLNNKFNLTEIDSIDDNSLIAVYNGDTLNYIKASVLKNYIGTATSKELSVTFTSDSTVEIGGLAYYRASCPGLCNFISRFDYYTSGSSGIYIGYAKIGDDTGYTNSMRMPPVEGESPAAAVLYITMGEGVSLTPPPTAMTCLIYGSEWPGTAGGPEGKRNDIFIYPGEYQVSIPFTVTFSAEPFADSGSGGSDQFDGKTIKITTDNQTTWENGEMLNQAYYTVIPGIFDALKDNTTGNSITVKVTDEDGSSDTFPKSGYIAYFQKPDTYNSEALIMLGPESSSGEYVYTYYMVIMSGTGDTSVFPSEIVKKDTVVLLYSLTEEGKEVIEPAARTGYPKTFELTFN